MQIHTHTHTHTHITHSDHGRKFCPRLPAPTRSSERTEVFVCTAWSVWQRQQCRISQMIERNALCVGVYVSVARRSQLITRVCVCVCVYIFVRACVCIFVRAC